ncbi:MAG: hypothetical protein P1P90_00385 [Patescibacteria group bacterium]|nr:hypothetical protein [Patescibacteria group bacterium]
MEKQTMDDLLYILRTDARYVALELQCVTCYSMNVSWLPELQDWLEEKGLVEAFCKTSNKRFFLKNGRLRLHACTCVSPQEIVDWIKEAEGAINL